MSRVLVWEQCFWPQLREAADEKAVVVIPLGATEQHGPHLPLCTDTLIATEVAMRAAERAAVPVVVGPSLSLGYSAHHRHLPGTVTLRAETLTRLLCDVCHSVHSHGFERIFVLNAHGGNVAFVDASVAVLAEEGIFIAAASWWSFAAAALEQVLESPLGGASHACELETSMLLSLAPELVESDRPVELSRAETDWGWFDFRAGGQGVVTFPLSPLTLSPSGVYGDPSLATASKGAAILEHTVTELARFLTELHRWHPEGEKDV